MCFDGKHLIRVREWILIFIIYINTSILFLRNQHGWQGYFIYQEYLYTILEPEFGSTEYKTFMEMEKKLMKYIMNPSLYLTWFLEFHW